MIRDLGSVVADPGVPRSPHRGYHRISTPQGTYHRMYPVDGYYGIPQDVPHGISSLTRDDGITGPLIAPVGGHQRSRETISQVISRV